MKNQRPRSLLFILISTLLLHALPIQTSQQAAATTTITVAIAADSTTTKNMNTSNAIFIRKCCESTLYPNECYNSLSVHANAIKRNPAWLAREAINVTLSKAKNMTTYLSNLSRQVDLLTERRAIAALRDCLDVFGDAVDRIRDSLKQMCRLGGSRDALRFQLSNVQTWMSGALTNQETCTDEFEDVINSSLKKDVCGRVLKVKMVTSNALALVNSYVSKVTTR